MNDISRKTLQKIKTELVQPLPRWRFIFRRSVMWGLFFLSLILGSLASSVVIFHLNHTDWDLCRHLHHGFLESSILFLPVLWFIFMLGFAGFAFFYFRHTERGYRYSAVWVILASLILSQMGGALVYKFGVSEKLEMTFNDRFSFYRKIEERRARVWVAPERGLLAGEIVDILGRQRLRLKDFLDHSWIIDISRARWRGRMKPRRHLAIKILGKLVNQGFFRADEIRPWRGWCPGMRRRHHRKGSCGNPRGPK